MATISYYSPHISGLTICAQRLIEGLASLGYRFSVLTSQYDRSFPPEERHDGVTIFRLPVLATIGKVPIMLSYPFVAWRLIRKADLVWIHVPQAEGLLVALSAKLIGKRIVSTVHCLPLLPSGWQRIAFQWLFDLVNNLIIMLSDRVVYYTEDYARNTKELWHFPKKSSYIYPPIPEPEKGPKVKWLEDSKRKIFHIGFAGRVAADKGIEYLIDAVVQLRKRLPIKLLIAGRQTAVGERVYRSRIDALVKHHTDLIQFLGTIPPERMSEFYRQIDVLVLPSVNRTEAFGMVQVEAMRHGVPVIASDLPGVRVPVKTTGFGATVHPRNPRALADAIQEVVSKKWQVEEISGSIQRSFHVEQTLTKYWREFDALVH